MYINVANYQYDANESSFSIFVRLSKFEIYNSLESKAEQMNWRSLSITALSNSADCSYI